MVKVLAGRANKAAVLSQGGDPYRKGALITLALDIKIREDTDGKRKFDDVLQHLNTHFHGKRPSSSDLNLILLSLTGKDYTDFFNKYVRGSKYPEEIFTAGRDSYLAFLRQELEGIIMSMNLNFFEAIFDRNFADKMGNINELREVEG